MEVATASSLSSFSPPQPLGSAASIKIAFRVRNTDGTNPLARCDDTNYYGHTVAAHDLLKGREYNRPWRVSAKWTTPASHAQHQGGYADVLLRPTMVGILRSGKMLPPQLNLVIEIEFADATTALWSENAGAHPSGATLSTFEISPASRTESRSTTSPWRAPSRNSWACS